MAESLKSDRYFLALRAIYDNQLFTETFQSGFLNYECGEWQIARDAFTVARNLLHRNSSFASDQVRTDETESDKHIVDGPSDFMIKFMAKYHFSAPLGWNGARTLEGI
jgi:hypothetical protein